MTRTDTGWIRDYLRNIADVEKFIYEQNEIAEGLRQRQYEILHAPYENRVRTVPTADDIDPGRELAGNAGYLTFLFTMAAIGISAIISKNMTGSELWAALITAVCGFITYHVAKALTGRHMDMEKNERRRKFVKEQTDTNRLIDLRNREDKETRMKKSDAIDREMEFISGKLKEATALRERLYSPGIININYRGLVPVLAMLSYFESERCFSFAGPGGAYNLYEDDLKWGRLYEELDDIWDAIDDLRNIHEYIRDEITGCYYRIDSMEQNFGRAISRIGKQNCTLMDEARIAAYNSRIAKETAGLNTLLIGTGLIANSKNRMGA